MYLEIKVYLPLLVLLPRPFPEGFPVLEGKLLPEPCWLEVPLPLLLPLVLLAVDLVMFISKINYPVLGAVEST
jgi:hypothetical protein